MPASYDNWLEQPYQRNEGDLDDAIQDEIEIEIYSHIDGEPLKKITIERSFHPSKEHWIYASYNGKEIKRLSQTFHWDITKGFGNEIDTNYKIIHEK